MKQINEVIYNTIMQMDQSMTPVHKDVYNKAVQRVYSDSCIDSERESYITHNMNGEVVSVFKYIDSRASQFGTVWSGSEVMDAIDDVEHEMI